MIIKYQFDYKHKLGKAEKVRLRGSLKHLGTKHLYASWVSLRLKLRNALVSYKNKVSIDENNKAIFRAIIYFEEGEKDYGLCLWCYRGTD